MKKESAIPSMGPIASTMAKTLLGGLAMGIAGEGVSLASDVIGDSIRRVRAYNRMLIQQPDLRMKEEKQVKDIFSAFYRFAPNLAEEPSVAATFVSRILETTRPGEVPMITHDVIQNLIHSQSQLNQMKGNRFGSRLGTTLAQSYSNSLINQLMTDSDEPKPLDILKGRQIEQQISQARERHPLELARLEKMR